MFDKVGSIEIYRQLNEKLKLNHVEGNDYKTIKCNGCGCHMNVDKNVFEEMKHEMLKTKYYYKTI